MGGCCTKQKSAQLAPFQSRRRKRREEWKRASEGIRACLWLRVAMNPITDPCLEAKHGTAANGEPACAHVIATECALLIGCRRRCRGMPGVVRQLQGQAARKQPRRHTGTDLDASSAKHVNTHLSQPPHAPLCYSLKPGQFCPSAHPLPAFLPITSPSPPWLSVSPGTRTQHRAAC